MDEMLDLMKRARYRYATTTNPEEHVYFAGIAIGLEATLRALYGNESADAILDENGIYQFGWDHCAKELER